jgi:DNA-binding transcriptional regulator YiaG
METSNTSIEAIPTYAGIDKMKTKLVAQRYLIEYNSLHNRMTKLGIKPSKEGRESFLSGTDIELLDRLHSHLSISGNTFSNFVIEEGEAMPLEPKSLELTKSTNKNTSIVTNEALIEVLNLFTQRQYDILTPQKKLQEAVEYSFLLTTEQVSQILNFSKSTVSSWKSGTQRLGFIFTRQKEGSTVLWKVEKH